MANSRSPAGKILALVLILACVAWIIWEVRGQQRDDAATRRCQYAADEYSCRACCGDDHVSRFGGGIPRKGKCGCYVQRR
ncbi:MAG TPA: hypothetical protein VGH28_29655 [Polyangiaceae bacterium]